VYGVPGIQLGNGRIKGPLPGAQGDDSDPRAAIVGQDVPQSPRGFLWAAHPESFRTRHRSVPFSGTRPRFAALILLLAQRPPLCFRTNVPHYVPHHEDRRAWHPLQNRLDEHLPIRDFPHRLSLEDWIEIIVSVGGQKRCYLLIVVLDFNRSCFRIEVTPSHSLSNSFQMNGSLITTLM